MHNKSTFRQQQIVRGFAFACVVASAMSIQACTTTGAVTPSAEQQIQKTCTDAETGIAVATLLVKTPAQANALDIASTAVQGFCNPSALAAYTTDAAMVSAAGSVAAILAKVNAPVIPAATPVQ